MELKIYSPQDAGFVKRIEWNFEELKNEVMAVARDYETLAYTDDTMKEAKADRAKLNKFVDALNAERTKVRKKLLEPDEQFGKEVKELTGIVQKAIDSIDGQIKGYERKRREEKTAKVREIYDENIRDLEPYLPFERVFRPEYANSTTTMKSIREEILALIQKVAEGLSILNEVESKFAGDMKAEFLRSYDIGAAMSLRNRLETEERRRQEYQAQQERIRAEREAREKEAAAAVMAAGRAPAEASATASAQQSAGTATSAVSAPMETVEDPVNIIDFRVYATAAQLSKLKAFLKAEGIRFGRVPER